MKGEKMGKDLKGKELGVGLSQRKDSRYSARFVDKYGKRREFYDFKLPVVKKWLNDIKYENEHDLICRHNNLTVDEWFWVWVENYKKDVVSHSTYKNYKNIYVNHIKNKIGDKYLNKVKPIHLQEILNEMFENGFSYGTTNLTKITMGALFEGAVVNDYISKNPVKTIKCKQREVEDRRVLTIDEQDEFLKYSDKSMYRNAYKLVLQTGLRSGEVGGLRFDDIDFENRLLYVKRTLLFDKNKGGFYFSKPKTKKSVREIPLTNEAIELLKVQKIEQFKLRSKSNNWDNNEDYQNLVFTSKNGKPTGHSTFNLNLVRIITNINNDRRTISKLNNADFVEFKPMFMHALRHTFATRCIESEMKPKTLQIILGHSTLATTMDLYVHVTDDEKFKEIEKLNGVKMA